MNKYVLKIVFKPLLMRDPLRCSNQFREGDVYTAWKETFTRPDLVPCLLATSTNYHGAVG